MNERIRELNHQALAEVMNGKDPDKDIDKMYIPKQFTKKFAELIVRECIEQIKLECEDFENGNCFHNKDLWNLVTREYGINKERGFNPIGMSIHFESIIKHHFGVEE